MRPTDHFERVALAQPSLSAFVAGSESVSYGVAQRKIEELASLLIETGVVVGQTKIAVYSPNHISAMLCVLAILRAGAVWVPINPRNSLEDNAAVMDRMDCSILLVHSEFAGEFEALRQPRCRPEP